MRIWVLSTEYKPDIVGGLGVVATELAEAMQLKGVEVSVISMCHRPRVLHSVRKSVNITRLPHDLPYYTKQLKLYRANSTLRLLVDRERPDAIHIHSVQFTEVAAALRRRWRIPLVYTCHSLVLLDGPSKHKVMVAKSQERLLQLADRIVAPSLWLKQRMCLMYPYCEGKVHVIPNGTHIGSTVRHGPKHRLLYVGRLLPVKGVEELLEAVAILKNTHPQVQLDFAGTCSAKYMARLRQLAKTLKVQGHVRWLGFVPPDRLSRLYATHGAVIFPSRQESFGLVAIEALANGVPLVCTRSGGLEEFVRSDVASIISSRGSVGIAQAVREMWQFPRRTALRVRQGQRMAARFSWTHVAAQYDRLFRQLVSAGRR